MFVIGDVHYYLALLFLFRFFGGDPFNFSALLITPILHAYFDVFSGLLQAYIFANLTMLNISQGFNYDLYKERKKKKLEKQQAKQAGEQVAVNS